MPNTRISTIDETNSGTTVADNPAMLIVRSSQRPACMADHTPPAMPSGTTTMNASRAELRRMRQRVGDERRDRLAIRIRQAHVAAHEMRDPLDVLRHERPVRAELMIERGDRARIGERPEHRAADIAGQQLAAREHDHRQQPQRDQRQADARRQKARDAAGVAARDRERAEGVTVVDIVISCRNGEGLGSSRLSRAQHRAIEIELRERGEAHAVHTLAHGDQLIVKERNDHRRFVEQ